MTQVAFEDIKRAMAQLSLSQLREIESFAVLGQSQKEKADRHDVMFAEAFREALHKRLRLAIRNSDVPSVSKARRIADDFIVELGVEKLTVMERQRAYDLFASLLCEHALNLSDALGISVSVPFVLKQAHRLPFLFDQAFPGYAASGMAERVLKISP